MQPCSLRCGAVLATIGDLVSDVVVWVPGPLAHATDTPVRVMRTRGGSAANVAAFAAATGPTARFLGRVGADEVGSAMVASLKACGVDARVEQAGYTGTVVVLVEPEGERTMLSDRGASTELAGIEPGWLTGITWLHVPAYSLVVNPLGEASRTAIELVRESDGAVSVDVSSTGSIDAFGVDRFVDMLADIAPDVVFANESECDRLGERASGPWLLVRKAGPRPVTVRGPELPGVEVEVPVVAHVVDTTGAGDAFAAGYINAALARADPAEAAAAGVRVAARNVVVAGAELAPE